MENKENGGNTEKGIFHPRRGTQAGQKHKIKSSHNGIFKLSSRTFTQDEEKVLKKCRTFAPTNKPNKFEMFIDTEKCIRKIMLKKAFAKNDCIEKNYTPCTDIKEDPFLHTSLKKKSDYIPSKDKGNYIKMYEECIKKKKKCRKIIKQIKENTPIQISQKKRKSGFKK